MTTQELEQKARAWTVHDLMLTTLAELHQLKPYFHLMTQDVRLHAERWHVMHTDEIPAPVVSDASK